MCPDFNQYEKGAAQSGARLWTWPPFSLISYTLRSNPELLPDKNIKTNVQD